MSQETPSVRKLTAEDLPELAHKNTSAEGTCCCYWKPVGAGWEKVGDCKEGYSNEDDCARNTPGGATAYSWSPYAC